jgi:hypothetical protein
MVMFGMACVLFVGACFARDVEREMFKDHLQKEMEKDYIITPKRQEVVRKMFNYYKPEGNA